MEATSARVRLEQDPCRSADADGDRDLPFAYAEGVPSRFLEPSASALSRRASDLPLLGRKGRLVRVSIAVFESVRPVSTGWPASSGMGGRLPSESVAGLHQITHVSRNLFQSSSVRASELGNCRQVFLDGSAELIASAFISAPNTEAATALCIREKS